MKRDDLMWLVGYLEGEGCFCSCKHGGQRPDSLRTVVSVCSVDKDVVRKAARLMGCKMRVPNRKTVTGKQVYEARIQEHKAAVSLMTTILPFMGKRRKEKIKRVLEQSRKRPGTAHGENQGSAKLTNRMVKNIIRQSFKQNDKGWVSITSRSYSVSPATIYGIVSGRTWKHLRGTLLKA